MGAKRWKPGSVVSVGVVLLVVCLCGRAAAANYEVSPSGTDGSCTGTLRTIGYAINNCWRAPGDVLTIRGGQYPEQLHTFAGTSWPSGTASAPMTIRGAPGETVVINPTGHERAGHSFGVIHIESSGDYLIFDNLTVDASNASADPGGATGVFTSGKIAGLVIKNSKLRGACCGNAYTGEAYASQFVQNEVSDNGAYAFYLGGPGNVVENNDIHDNKGYGVHVYNGSWDCRGNPACTANTIIRNNRVVHNGWDNANPAGSCAVLLSSGSGIKACNNEIRDHNGCGVQVYGGTIDAQVLGNTIIGNRDACIDVQAGYDGRNPAQGTIVRGNSCQGNGRDILNDGVGSVIAANGAGGAAPATDCGGTPFVGGPRPLPPPTNLRSVRVRP